MSYATLTGLAVVMAAAAIIFMYFKDSRAIVLLNPWTQ